MLQIDARAYPRRIPSFSLEMSFTLEGRHLAGVEVVGVGLGGIGAWMDEGYASLFKPYLRLREVLFSHPDFPRPVPDMQLVFSTLKGQSAVPGRMMFGAQFIEPTPEFMEALDKFLGSPAFEGIDPGAAEAIEIRRA